METVTALGELIIKHGGLAGVVMVMWMVDRWLLVRDLRAINDRIIDALNGNSEALSRLSTLIQLVCQKL